jgi:hypothetical protein
MVDSDKMLLSAPSWHRKVPRTPAGEAGPRLAPDISHGVEARLLGVIPGPEERISSG